MTDTDSVSGWKTIGDDVRRMSATAAPIWLGPGTTDCTVIRGRRPTCVLDEVVGNMLTNVTRLPLLATAFVRAATPMKSLKQVMQLKQMVRP